MSWLPHRRRAQKEREQAASEALSESVDRLHAAVVGGQETRRVAERLRELQRKNHFAENIAAAYVGRNR